jgi:preprotein translocase subunit SecD
MENLMRPILALPILVLFAGCTADKVETAGQAPAAVEKPVAIRFHLASQRADSNWEPLKDPDGRTIYVAPVPVLTEKDLASAQPVTDQLGRPCVEVIMTDEGAKKLARLTKENIGNMLAAFVDDELTMAATIQSVVSKRARISGHFTPERAQVIADSLNTR